jgi:integrase
VSPRITPERRTALTAAAIKKFLPGHKRKEIPDAASPGLRLIVQTSGHKSFALRFRRPDGRTGKLTLGPFDPLHELEGDPVVGGPLTLAAARRLAADIMRQRALGKDVISDHHSAKRRRKADHEQRAASGFATVAKRFIEEYARPRTRSWATSARMLGLSPSTLEPVKDGLAQRWRDRTIGEITVDDMDEVLHEVRTKGVPGLRQRSVLSDSTARAALLRYSKFFNWCREKRLIASNPTEGVGRPPPGASRERVLSDNELRWLWRAAGDLGYPFGCALRLLILSGQRRGEVGGMTWTELSEDRTTWTLPASRAKNGRAHVIPLSPASQTLISSVPVIGGPFMFTSDGKSHSAGWSKVKARLDARMAELARSEGTSVAPFVIHDVRRTVATGLQRLGVRLEVTESVLNHQSGSRAGIVATYQRYAYDKEKREALALWSDYVAKIVSDPATTAGASRVLATGA